MSIYIATLVVVLLLILIYYFPKRKLSHPSSGVWPFSENYSDTVTNSLSKMIVDNNLSITQVNSYIVSIENQFIRINIRAGCGHQFDFAVTIVPLPKEMSRYGYFFEDEYGLGTILQAYDNPNVCYQAKAIRNIAEFENELRRAGEVISVQCSKILNGDYSLWPTIKRMLALELKEYRVNHNNKIWMRLYVIKSNAELAFGRENYDEAFRLYSSINEYLSPLEKQRLSICLEKSTQNVGA
jgi:hypothetical protein